MLIKDILQFIFGIIISKDELNYNNKKFNPIKIMLTLVFIFSLYVNHTLIYTLDKIRERAVIKCPSILTSENTSSSNRNN